MDYKKYMTLDEFAETYYGGEPMTKARRNSLCKMCKDGWLNRYAKKLGKQWFIRKEVFDD